MDYGHLVHVLLIVAVKPTIESVVAADGDTIGLYGQTQNKQYRVAMTTDKMSGNVQFDYTGNIVADDGVDSQPLSIFLHLCGHVEVKSAADVVVGFLFSSQRFVISIVEWPAQ